MRTAGPVPSENLGDDTPADSFAPFPDGEPRSLFNRDRLVQADLHGHVVPRHAHVSSEEPSFAGDVGGAEEELRPIPVEKRSVAATLPRTWPRCSSGRKDAARWYRRG